MKGITIKIDTTLVILVVVAVGVGGLYVTGMAAVLSLMYSQLRVRRSRYDY